MNYYNEFDPHAAAWLQGLIDENLIPPGHVDTRSITEISPSDLHGYTQCHFFAGIGGWSLALQIAGVPSTRPLWTGSCPCQPFSVAGEGKGIEDERHLWPAFFALIRECKPDLIFGEQVASAAVVGSSAKPTKRDAGKPIPPVWLDGIFADLESASYACGSADIPAAGIGAPHIRQRLWWGAVRMADASLRPGQSGIQGSFVRAVSRGNGEGDADLRMADADNQHDDRSRLGRAGRRTQFADGGAHERMADSIKPRLEGYARNGDDGDQSGRNGTDKVGSVAEGGEFDHWGNSCWHPCRDGKYRRVPVEPVFQFVVNGVSDPMDLGGDLSIEEISILAEAAKGFPLTNPKAFKIGTKGTVRPGLLRGSGNAIVPQVGAEFVKAFLKSI